MKPKLILASGSKNRIQALTLARIPFTSILADIDEKAIVDNDIYTRVIKIAEAKVKKVARDHQGIILGADGVNLCQGKVLEKPQDHREAAQMLRFQSGQTCSFLTGFYLLNTETGQSHSGTSETKYRIKQLSDAEIKDYIQREPVTTWSAALSPANSMAIRFVEHIEGSPSNYALSIPFEAIVPILQQEGIL